MIIGPPRFFVLRADAPFRVKYNMVKFTLFTGAVCRYGKKSKRFTAFEF